MEAETKQMKAFRKKVEKMGKKTFLNLFTPYSYYNSPLEFGTYECVYNMNIGWDKKSIESYIKQMGLMEQQITEVLYDKSLELSLELEDIISFEWLNVVYFFIFDEFEKNSCGWFRTNIDWWIKELK